MENKTIGIAFGMLFPTIAVQLKQQGFLFDAKRAKEFERFRSCIIDLQLGDILNDAAVDKAQQKLFKEIRAHVVRKNKLKIVKK